MLENLAVIIFILFNLCFLLVVAVLVVYMLSSLFVWPPSVPTDRKTRRIMVKQLKDLIKDKEHLNIADLGSGYGHLVRDVRKAFPKAKITGYEILYLPYYFSKLIFNGKQNITIKKADLFTENYSDIDAIVTFYHSIKPDDTLAKKVQNECKKGCIIITNNYLLEGVPLLKRTKVKLMIGKRYVYVYRV